MPSKSARSGKKKETTRAQRSDRRLLYEEAVQCVEAEIDFVDDTYHQLRGRKAKLASRRFLRYSEYVLRMGSPAKNQSRDRCRPGC